MYSMENPPHSQLSSTFKSEGEQSFLWMATGKSTVPSTPLKRVSCGKVALQKNPSDLVVELFWLYLPGILILWSELHQTQLRPYMSATLVLSLFWLSTGMKRGRLWIRERTFGAVKDQAVVLGYSTASVRGCWCRKFVRGHLFSSPKQKAPGAFAQLATS